MILHVLTACSRPENLEAVGESLVEAMVDVPQVEVRWHVAFDLERRHVGGQAVKNALLDGVAGGWVWILDDDTIAHPLVLAELAGAADECDALVVAQERAEGRLLEAGPEHVHVGSIDAGQALLRRELVGESRLPIDYNGDGMWLAEVLARAEAPYYANRVRSYHNWLS